MLILLALVGCQPLPEDPGAPSDPETTIPIDPFATDTGEPAPAVDLCPAHSGFGAVGSSRTFDKPTGTAHWTWTTTRLDADGHVTRAYDRTFVTPHGDSGYVRGEFHYRCDDDGAWLLSSHTVNGLDHDPASVTVTDITYTPPVLDMIHDPQPGESWSTPLVYEERWTHPDGTTAYSIRDRVKHVTVAFPSSVAVPAGTFEALRFETVVTIDETPYDSSFDAHPVLGLLRAEHARLVSWSEG